MPIENPRYDVAVSFLSKDVATASALNERLTESLQVFFFPRNQEELAGTDGLESMRKPFFDDSRVMVILFRNGWGETPWTRVEETAIKDSCLAHGWQRLFFVVLDPQGIVPLWVPHTHVRLNFAEYGLEQAAGAIKARVQEQGGRNLPPTPRRQAEILKAEELYQLDKAKLNSETGVKQARHAVHELFQEIKRHCSDLGMDIYCGIDEREGYKVRMCAMSTGQVSINVVWQHQYDNDLEDAELSVREFKGRLILPNDVSPFVQRTTGFRELSCTRYRPNLSRTREYGWKGERSSSDFESSQALAERLVTQLMKLASRNATRQLE